MPFAQDKSLLPLYSRSVFNKPFLKKKIRDFCSSKILIIEVKAEFPW